MDQIVFQIILFLSNTVQTITGFAGTMLAMPFSIRAVGIEEAKAVLNIFTLLACLIITIQNRKKINYKILVKMIAGMIIGMAAGVWMFNIVSVDILLKLYAVLVILISVKKMFINKEIKLPEWSMLIVLFCAGVIHGMFLSGGALLVVYAVTVLKDKDEFRATIAPVWVVLNTILIFNHYSAGYYIMKNLLAAVVSILPLAASLFVGNYLYSRINQNLFLKLTYILLFISGASLLI